MVNTKKLRKMARFIERNVPAKNFDMSVVFRTKAKTPKGILNALTNHTCGSVGCVMGYTPLVFPGEAQYGLAYPDDPACNFPTLMDKDGKPISFHKLAMRMFGISETQAFSLFGNYNNKTQQVRMMREFCKKYDEKAKK